MSRALLVVLALVGAACGARLNDQQMKAALGAQSGGGTSNTGGSSIGAGDASTPSGSAVGAGTGATATGGTAGAGTGAGGTSGGGSGPAAAGGGESVAPAPAGGNGGATDIGVTATELTVGNVSTLTGPVPGLFAGASFGTQAFFAYQNSLGGVYGRHIKVQVGDDRLDEGQNRSQIQALTPKVFAFVGSFSVTDSSGAAEMRKSGVPDVGYSLNPDRSSMPNNFSPQPLPPGWRLGPLNYFKQKFPAAIGKMANFWIANPTAREPAHWEQKAAESVGYKFAYTRELSTNETNFTADVVQMQQRGVKGIMMTSDVGTQVRMAKAMKQQNFSVPFANWGASAYDPGFVASDVRAATEGSLLDQQLAMYAGEDADKVPEVGLFLKWLRQVKSNQKPDIFAAFGWAASRLFVQALKDAGPKATRAGLIDALKKIDNFDSNGLLAPAGPATKRPPTCYLVIQVTGGKFVRSDPPSGFRCDDGGYFRL